MKRVAGTTLVEVMIGFAILVIAALAIGRASQFLHRQQVLTQQKHAADQVCQQLMQQVRSLAEGGTTRELDDIDDNERYNPSLSLVTIARRDYVLGGNQGMSRQINIFTVDGEPASRRVRVRVFNRKTKQLLAETVGFVRQTKMEPVPTQHFDFYYLASQGGYPLSAPKGISKRNFVLPPVALARERWSPAYAVHRFESPFNGNYTDLPTDKAYISDRNTADQDNHGVRYPDENANNPNVAVSIRDLLERMYRGDPNFKNLILVNAGIQFFLPPIRNYSDAAKDPANRPHVRAVTHPENIWAASGAQVRLRVYTYTAPALAGAVDTLDKLTITITPALPAATYPNIAVRKMVGDAAVNYSWADAANPADFTIADGVAGTTKIVLNNSPLRHPANAGKGLNAARRLYGMEYIPCLVDDDAGFAEGDHDLADNGNHAKNTARWTITMPAGAVPDGMLRISTRLGDDQLATGTKVSHTFVWVNRDVPITERYQFIGDPRHMPYADVKNYHGYNWFFTRVSGDGYDGFDKTRDGWVHREDYPVANNDQVLNFDFPRYMQVFREALLNSNSILSLGDASYRDIHAVPMAYASLGGGTSFAWTPVGMRPFRGPQTAWVPNSAAQGRILETVDPTGRAAEADHMGQRLVAKVDNSWVSLPWLGELYPDDRVADWVANNNNLPTGPGNFYRAPYSVLNTAYPGMVGGTMEFSSQIVGAGLSTLVNGNSTGAGNSYVYNSFNAVQTGTHRAEWKTVENLFQIYLGRNTDNVYSRFNLNENSIGSRPPAYNEPEYANTRTRISVVREFMAPSAGGSFPYVSALLRLQDPADATRNAYLVINGNDNVDWNYELGSAQSEALAAWSFLEAGSPAIAPASARAQPIPLVEFSAPQSDAILQNPTQVTVNWSTAWRRWDGGSYTPDFPAGYTNASPVTYHLFYTGGDDWKDVTNDAIASSSMEARYLNNNVQPPYNWDVSGLPEGRYTLRVYAFRDSNHHFAFHDRRIEIKR